MPNYTITGFPYVNAARPAVVYLSGVGDTFYPASKADFQSNVSLSGATFSVGAVSVTGGYIGITGNVAVTGVSVSVGAVSITGGYLTLTGVPLVRISATTFYLQQVALSGDNQIGVSGGVTVANFPLIAQLSGTNNVTITNPVAQVLLTGTNTVTVSNPTTQVLLTGTNTVTVSNPTTQVLLTGSNSVSISNSPTVVVPAHLVGQSGLWNVAVSGQPVWATGTFSIGNSPTVVVPAHEVGQSGLWNVAVSGQPIYVTGTVVITGNQNVCQSASSTPTVLGILSVASPTLLTGSNANRIGLSFYNNATTPVYVKWGTTGVSPSSFSFILASGDYYEMPLRYTTAALVALWQGTPTGSGMLTELA
jgi:hypothetical protein